MGATEGLQATPVRGAQRRLQAARLVRLLSPAALSLGGFASAELRVRLRDGLWRPDVSVALDELPVDGISHRAPVLVVELGPGAGPGRWLRAGAKAVWVIGDHSAQVHTAGAPPRDLRPPEDLFVPGLAALSLPVVVAWPTPARPGVGLRAVR